MAHFQRIGAFAGFVAAASMTITPAYAAEVTSTGSSDIATSFLSDLNADDAFGSSTYEETAETAEYHRRYRGYRRYRRNRIDAGDVVAGVLILGGIAAVASAASNNNRRDRYRERERVRVREREDNRRYDQRRTTRSTNSGSGLENAVSMCRNEIEQDVRVESVDGASRVAEGWVVSGTIFNGSSFTCQIDNNGRISNVDYSGFANADNQWSDDRYADARASLENDRYARADIDADVDDGPQPAYPGGPLPGEELSE